MRGREGAGKLRVLQSGRAWAAVASDLAELLRSLRLPNSPLSRIHVELRSKVRAALETLGLHGVALKILREGPERPPGGGSASSTCTCPCSKLWKVAR